MVSAPLRSWHATRAARELPDSKNREHGISLPWAIHSTQPRDWLLKALVGHCTLDRIEHLSLPRRNPSERTPSSHLLPHPCRLVLVTGASWFHAHLPCSGSAFSAAPVHRPTIYAPRFLSALGRSHAVAFHFAHCDQLAAGLAPAGMRPCWAHHKKTHLKNQVGLNWLREKDLNLRPLGYEPNELPDCSIARQK